MTALTAVALALLTVRPDGAGVAAPPDCASTDGPQFACWLSRLPVTR